MLCCKIMLSASKWKIIVMPCELEVCNLCRGCSLYWGVLWRCWKGYHQCYYRVNVHLFSHLKHNYNSSANSIVILLHQHAALRHLTGSHVLWLQKQAIRHDYWKEWHHILMFPTCCEMKHWAVLTLFMLVIPQYVQLNNLLQVYVCRILCMFSIFVIWKCDPKVLYCDVDLSFLPSLEHINVHLMVMVTCSRCESLPHEIGTSLRTPFGVSSYLHTGFFSFHLCL